MKPGAIFQYILGALIVVGFFTVLFALVVRPAPTTNSELLYLIIGALIGNFGTVVSYYFGSSAGSAKKDEIISNIK